MNYRFQDGRNFMSWCQNKRHLHARTLLSKALNIQAFASTHFSSIPGFFIIRSKKTNLRSLTNYIEKERFIIKRRRDLGLEGRNIPDGEGKQEDIQLMRSITLETMQEEKMRNKNGSLQGGERKLAKSEINNLEEVQGDLWKRTTS